VFSAVAEPASSICSATVPPDAGVAAMYALTPSEAIALAATAALVQRSSEGWVRVAFTSRTDTSDEDPPPPPQADSARAAAATPRTGHHLTFFMFRIMGSLAVVGFMVLSSRYVASVAGPGLAAGPSADSPGRFRGSAHSSLTT
jgi:hypothetical protein